MALDSPPLERLMKILAIDTASWDSSVVLWEDGHELSFQEKTHARDQSALLPQLVKDVLGEHKVDLLLVNLGPGSFTGIRVGLAFAKGFALGLGVPLRGIDSFMATYMSLDSQQDVLILLEAHRPDVFGMFFQKGLPSSPQSFTREEVEQILDTPAPPLLAGSGVHPFLDGLTFQSATPHRRGAQRLAHAFFKEPSLASDAFPFYVREADVSFSRHI